MSGLSENQPMSYLFMCEIPMTFIIVLRERERQENVAYAVIPSVKLFMVFIEQ